MSHISDGGRPTLFSSHSPTSTVAPMSRSPLPQPDCEFKKGGCGVITKALLRNIFGAINDMLAGQRDCFFHDKLRTSLLPCTSVSM